MLTMAVRFQVQLHPKRRAKMINRTIEFLFDREDQAALEQATDPTEVLTAMGYLLQWNFSLPHVRLMITADDELKALYYKDKPEPDSHGRWPRPNYVIAAVWHDDHFGIHS
jgi:hypothetical protein